jgi:hypothetical protein
LPYPRLRKAPKSFDYQMSAIESRAIDFPNGYGGLLI